MNFLKRRHQNAVPLPQSAAFAPTAPMRTAEVKRSSFFKLRFKDSSRMIGTNTLIMI